MKREQASIATVPTTAIAGIVERQPITAMSPAATGGTTRFPVAPPDRPTSSSSPGPFSLPRRLRPPAYADPADLVRALARWLNAEARALVAAGADLLQIDEPFLAGYPEAVELAIEAVNIVTEGVGATWALHVCYGNRYARPLWEGHYDFLFPAVLAARIDQLVLEFARKGPGDLRLFRQHAWDRRVGLGVIDVKSADVESPDLVASRIRRALDFVPADRLVINPDCGLRHLPANVARAKLRAMVAGAAQVRGEQRSGEHPDGVASPSAGPSSADINGSAAAAGQTGLRPLGNKEGASR